MAATSPQPDNHHGSRLSVTAIVPTYNRAALLGVALDSLLAQSRPPEEIIVVDDASTDETGEVVRGYGARVTYLRNEQNCGKPASLNRTIPTAGGNHIWIFDDDDVALPDALATHLACLAAHPDIDFTYSDKYLFEGNGDIWQRQEWRISPLPERAPEDFLLATMYSMNTLFQGMLVPGRCYQHVGGFDETLLRCEDHEMLLRLAAAFRGANVGRPTFVYRAHEGARGAGHNSHAAGSRFQVMLEYRQRIFRGVRERLPLACYLDSRDRRASLSESGARALAQLQRGCIMLHHGLVDEALADLDEAFSQAHEPSAYFAARVAESLARAVDVEPWTIADKTRLLRALGALLHQHGLGGRGRNVAAGLYWSARRSFGKHEYRNGLDAARMFAVFCAHWVTGFVSSGRGPPVR